jgi:hypothetical protein
MLWISYLCNSRCNTRVKEYFYEPYITQLQQLINIKKYIKYLPQDTPQYDQYSTIDIAEIDSKICSIKSTLKAEGYNIHKSINNKKIIELTERNPLLLGLYNTFYNESSKFEHADITTTRKFRESVVEDISSDDAFIFNMSRSDITLWKSVFKHSLNILFLAIEKVFCYIKDNEKHLFDFKQFNEIDFSSLIVNIKIAIDGLESIAD